MKDQKLDDLLKEWEATWQRPGAKEYFRQLGRIGLLLIVLLIVVYSCDRLKEIEKEKSASNLSERQNQAIRSGRGKYDPDLPVLSVDPIQKERALQVPRPVPCNTIAQQTLARD